MCQLESLWTPLPEDQRGVDGSSTDSSIGRRRLQSPPHVPAPQCSQFCGFVLYQNLLVQSTLHVPAPPIPMFLDLWVHLAPEPLVQSITTISACSTPLCSQFCLVPKPFGTINHHMCLHPQSPSSHVPRSVGSSCARTFKTITIVWLHLYISSFEGSLPRHTNIKRPKLYKG